MAVATALMFVTLSTRVRAQSALNAVQATNDGDRGNIRTNDASGKTDEQAPGHEGAPLYAWLFLGTGAVFTLTGIALYVDGVASYPSACRTQTGQCPPGTSAENMARASNADDVRGFGVAVGLVGLAALATGLSLFYFAPWRGTTSRIYAAPSVGSRFAGVDVALRF